MPSPPSPSSPHLLTAALALSFFAVAGAITGAKAAEKGKPLYTTYCSACHAEDGKGANNGAFPPLFNSPWIKGNPDPAIQVVLRGLEGPITVPTATNPNARFNLVMPPQGGTLTDLQIAYILTYVRSSWGNKESPVTLEQVIKNRRATSHQKAMWKSSALLKLHPIHLSNEKQSPPIKNLISKIYHGTWEKHPDFSKLKPVAIEEEHTGLVSLSKAGKIDNFGIVWDGELTIPQDGTYTFKIDSDDGSAIFIGGKLIAEVKGTGGVGRAQSGKITLKKGIQPIRVEYFEFNGDQDLILLWSGPGIKGEQSLADTSPQRKGPLWPSIPINPPTGGTALYRGFIADTTPRAIGVGYHGGINLAFSADHLGIQLLWQGRFFDGGHHWTDRGQGNEPPAGKNTLRLTSLPSWGTLDPSSGNWISTTANETKPRFRGYQLGANDRPAFHYEIGPLQITDTPTPIFKNKNSPRPGISRTLQITVPASGTPKHLHLLLCDSLDIHPTGNKKEFLLGNKILIQVTSPHTPKILNHQLILPLNLNPGKNQITLHYQWK